MPTYLEKVQTAWLEILMIIWQSQFCWKKNSNRKMHLYCIFHSIMILYFPHFPNRKIKSISDGDKKKNMKVSTVQDLYQIWSSFEIKCEVFPTRVLIKVRRSGYELKIVVKSATVLFWSGLNKLISMASKVCYEWLYLLLASPSVVANLWQSYDWLKKLERITCKQWFISTS